MCHGNLITDRNKNITAITYNHLNLPTKITFNGDANQYISITYNHLNLPTKITFNGDANQYI
ncbi:MAG: hypothetical protein COS19_10925, partial [Flavobacteriaceae bacterium CG02_land_8_20_14_3_00_34_13]